MAYQRTTVAEQRKYKVVIICLEGSCFTSNGSVVHGAPDFTWQHENERIVYVYEGVDPLARVKLEERLVLEGFRPVDGDKVVIFSPRRPRVSNDEFWQRTLDRARQLGGQVSIVGNGSPMFRYLLRNPELSKKVLRSTPAEWSHRVVVPEHRQAIARLATQVLYPRSLTGHELDRDKHFRWTEGLFQSPALHVVDGLVWLELPQEFKQSWLNEDSAEGQFVLAMKNAGYDVQMISCTGSDGWGNAKSGSFVVVKLC